MGARHPDRIPIAEFRRGAETVWAMLQANWEVISRCRICGLTMPVDLDLVCWTSGPNTSLWNQHPRCRRIGCQGYIDFQGRAPRRSTFDTLDAEWPPGKDRAVAAPERLADILIGPRRVGARCKPCGWSRGYEPVEAIKTFGLQASLDDIQVRLRGHCTNPECSAVVVLGRARRIR